MSKEASDSFDKKLGRVSNDPNMLNFLSIGGTGSTASLSAKQNVDHLESKTKTFDKFLSGFKRFQEHYIHGGLFETLKKGQSPKTLVIACCDSRADPAMYFYYYKY